MNILLLGSGGREHAIAWKLSQSKKLDKLFIAPGNAGTQMIGTNISLDLKNFQTLELFISKNKINMLIIGPENIIVDGIYDYMKTKFDDLIIIAPSQKASLLEGSKSYAKKFMQKHNIPTANYSSFKKGEFQDAVNYLQTTLPPYVLKADGLAGGKGVVILDSVLEAKKELKKMLIENKFGKASNEVLIEDFMTGTELSVFVLTNGKSYKILPVAKDYKRIGEGDVGLNTGGMGSVSPVPFANKDFMRKVEQLIIKPTINGLKKEKIEYYGFIFFGLINVNGSPKVIEYNVRLGDPETQVVLPRIKSDLIDILSSIKSENKFQKQTVEISQDTCATVILTSKGYPEKYQTNDQIFGLEGAHSKSLIFHAGTKKENQKIMTSGGRVLAITSVGNNIKDAVKHSYDTIKQIKFEGMYYRKDIGLDVLP